MEILQRRNRENELLWPDSFWTFSLVFVGGGGGGSFFFFFWSNVGYLSA